MDPESLSVEAVLRVTDWLRTKWEMRRANTAPVQQWVDSIPSLTTDECDHNTRRDANKSNQKVSGPNMTVSSVVPNSPSIITPAKLCPNTNKLARDLSVQSDSSHCSSVESLLELRKPDPEAILLSLGFGGSRSSLEDNGPLSRIPKRFLKPSALKGIDIDQFIRKQNEATESLDSASLGYRGLTGTPYVAPSEIVQKIIERLHEHDSHDRDQQNSHSENKFSVLSPDNRHFLEQNRSKSPDMRNKRMIIGQKSFVFAENGELIELENSACHSKHDETVEELREVINEEANGSLEETDAEGKSCNETEQTCVNAPDQRHEAQRALGPRSTCDTTNSRRASLRKQRRINEEDANCYLDSLS